MRPRLESDSVIHTLGNLRHTSIVVDSAVSGCIRVRHRRRDSACEGEMTPTPLGYTADFSERAAAYPLHDPTNVNKWYGVDFTNLSSGSAVRFDERLNNHGCTDVTTEVPHYPESSDVHHLYSAGDPAYVGERSQEVPTTYVSWASLDGTDGFDAAVDFDYLSVVANLGQQLKSDVLDNCNTTASLLEHLPYVPSTMTTPVIPATHTTRSRRALKKPARLGGDDSRLSTAARGRVEKRSRIKKESHSSQSLNPVRKGKKSVSVTADYDFAPSSTSVSKRSSDRNPQVRTFDAESPEFSSEALPPVGMTRAEFLPADETHGLRVRIHCACSENILSRFRSATELQKSLKDVQARQGAIGTCNHVTEAHPATPKGLKDAADEMLEHLTGVHVSVTADRTEKCSICDIYGNVLTAFGTIGSGRASKGKRSDSKRRLGARARADHMDRMHSGVWRHICEDDGCDGCVFLKAKAEKYNHRKHMHGPKASVSVGRKQKMRLPRGRIASRNVEYA